MFFGRIQLRSSRLLGRPYYAPYPLLPRPGVHPVAVAPAAPPVYVERSEPAAQQQGMWYYCERRAVLSYVTECPGGWRAVPPAPLPRDEKELISRHSVAPAGRMRLGTHRSSVMVACPQQQELRAVPLRRLRMRPVPPPNFPAARRPSRRAPMPRKRAAAGAAIGALAGAATAQRECAAAGAAWALPAARSPAPAPERRACTRAGPLRHRVPAVHVCQGHQIPMAASRV